MESTKKLLISKTIFTGKEDKPFSGAVLIKGNKISEVYKNEEFLKCPGGDIEIHDFGEKVIMAGFVDAHTHFSWGATAASSHMCTDIERSIILEFAEKNPQEV